MRSLIGKLNDTTREAMEDAAGLCLARTHYDVEIEHYLMKLLDIDGYAISRASSITSASTRPARGGTDTQPGQAEIAAMRATPAFSPTMLKMLTEAWTIGSLDYGAGADSHRLYDPGAGLGRGTVARSCATISKELQKIEPDALRKDFAGIVAASHENGWSRPRRVRSARRRGRSRVPRPAARRRTSTSTPSI